MSSVDVCLEKNSFKRMIWIKMIRMKTCRRLQKRFKNYEDLGLFYLSAGIIISSVHVFEL